MEGRISWFLWSCGRKLRVPLELCGELGDPLVFPQEVRSAFELRGEPWDSSHFTAGMSRASSRVEAGTSEFLSISDINLGVSVEFEQGSQASSCVETWNSACLSSCEWGVRPLLELDLESAAFYGGCTWGVSAPLCCDLILGVPFESVQGHQALSRVNGEISVFGIVAQPTKVPVKFQCETGHFLRCHRNVGIPFQAKQGNRPSSRDEEGQMGSD